MVVREQVILHAKDLKTNVALLTASRKFSVLIISGKTNKQGCYSRTLSSDIPDSLPSFSVSLELPQSPHIMKCLPSGYNRCVLL